MARRTESTPLTLLPALKSHLWFASCPEPFQLALIERLRGNRAGQLHSRKLRSFAEVAFQ